MEHLHFSILEIIAFTAPCTRRMGREINDIVQILIDTIPTISQFLQDYDRELAWLYPFAWAVIIVRKMFYA